MKDKVDDVAMDFTKLKARQSEIPIGKNYRPIVREFLNRIDE